MASDLPEGDYTEQEFTKVFLRTRFDEDGSQSVQRVYIMKTIYDIFNELKPYDCDVLDFGCGPTLYASMGASKYAKSITLAEYSEVNREELFKWKEKHADAHDWTPFFKATAKLEDCDWGEIEKRMRSCLGNIIPCDILSDNTLPTVPGDGSPQKYDIIISSLCLNAACYDRKTYSLGVTRLGKLLKPGGTLIITEFLEEDKWTLGHMKIPVGYITKADINYSLEQSGFEKPDWITIDTSIFDKNKFGPNGLYLPFTVSAKKK